MEPKDKISEIIKNKGYIPLDEFIDISLLRLEKSYYRSQRPLGSKGDFITAPEISQLYGEIIGIYIADYIQRNQIEKFNLIELGPGKGTLMSDIIRILSSIFKKNLNYQVHFVEINTEYKDNLKKIFKDCNIHTSIDNLPKDKSIIIANEFFDVFPIVQAQKIDNKIYETVISLVSNKFVFDKKEIRNKYANLFNINELIENQIVEKSPVVNFLFEKIVKFIKKNKGMILVMDYGYVHNNNNNNNNSLQSIKDNKKTYFLNNVGKQDLTSLVNFDVLLNILDKNNVKTNTIQSQRDFLIKNGINLRAEMLIKKNRELDKIITNQVSRLTDIDKMGSLFKFLIFDS